jgi:hypothetical protein
MSRNRDIAGFLGKTEAVNAQNLPLSTGGTGIDSAATFALIDSDYITARAGSGTVDSATVLSLVDSDYITARSASGTVDSATVLSLVDSDYVIARAPAGGADSGAATLGYEFERTFQYSGTLAVADGDQRFYFNKDTQLKTILATVGTSPVGSDLIVKIQKNDSDITDTITLASGASTKSLASTTSFLKNDFATVDITQVGSTTPGANLFVNMLFEKSVTEFFKSYHKNGDLSVYTGDQRFYLQGASILKNVEAYVKGAPVGAAMSINIVKNDATTIKTVTIADGQYNSGTTNDTINLAKDDYLTINITQVGSTTAGSDLYVNLTFNKG